MVSHVNPRMSVYEAAIGTGMGIVEPLFQDRLDKLSKGSGAYVPVITLDILN